MKLECPRIHYDLGPQKELSHPFLTMKFLAFREVALLW